MRYVYVYHNFILKVCWTDWLKNLPTRWATAKMYINWNYTDSITLYTGRTISWQSWFKACRRGKIRSDEDVDADEEPRGRAWSLWFRKSSPRRNSHHIRSTTKCSFSKSSTPNMKRQHSWRNYSSITTAIGSAPIYFDISSILCMVAYRQRAAKNDTK